MMNHNRGKTARFEDANRLAAATILAHAELYAGLPLEWARLWTSRHRFGLRSESMADQKRLKPGRALTPVRGEWG